MSNVIVGMDELPINSNGIILSINLNETLKRKLMDMGLVRGTEFKVDGMAPLGDPIRIKLRGYSLALRKNEAKNIKVEKI